MSPHGRHAASAARPDDGPWARTSDRAVRPRHPRRDGRSHRRCVIGELGCRLLDEACEAACVKVGAYDHRILIWLAGFEPEACAVVADLITRPHQTGTAVTGERPVTLTATQAAVVRRALADADGPDGEGQATGQARWARGEVSDPDLARACVAMACS